MILQIQINPQQFRPRTTQSRALAQEEEQKHRELSTYEPGGIGGVIGPPIEKATSAFKGVFNFIKEPFLEIKDFLSPMNFGTNLAAGADDVPAWLKNQPLGVSAMWLAGLKERRREKKITEEEYHRQVRGGISTILTVASLGAVNPVATKASTAIAGQAASKLLPTAPGQFLAKILGKVGVKGALGERMLRHSTIGVFDGAFFGGGFAVLEPMVEEEAVRMDAFIAQTMIGAAAGGVLGASLPVIGKGFTKVTHPLRKQLTGDQRRAWLTTFRDEIVKYGSQDEMAQTIARMELPKTSAELLAQSSLGRFDQHLANKGFFGWMRNTSGQVTGKIFNRFNTVERMNPTLVQRAYDWLDARTTVPHYMAKKLNDLVLYDLKPELRTIFYKTLLKGRMEGQASVFEKLALDYRAKVGGAQTSLIPALKAEPADLTDDILSAILKGDQPLDYSMMRALEMRAKLLREEALQMITPEESAAMHADFKNISAFIDYREFVEPILLSLYKRNGGQALANTAKQPFTHAVPVSSITDVQAWARGDIQLYIPNRITASIGEKLTKQLGRQATAEEIKAATATRLERIIRMRRYKHQAKVIGGAAQKEFTQGIAKESPFAKQATFFAPAYYIEPDMVLGNSLRIAMTVDRENAFISQLLLDPRVVRATSKQSIPPAGYEAVYIRGNAHVIESRLKANYDDAARQWNLGHSVEEMGLVGTADPGLFGERLIDSMSHSTTSQRVERLNSLVKHNLVNKAKSNPVVASLLQKASGDKQYIPVETARTLFRDVTQAGVNRAKALTPQYVKSVNAAKSRLVARGNEVIVMLEKEVASGKTLNKELNATQRKLVADLDIDINLTYVNKDGHYIRSKPPLDEPLGHPVFGREHAKQLGKQLDPDRVKTNEALGTFRSEGNGQIQKDVIDLFRREIDKLSELPETTIEQLTKFYDDLEITHKRHFNTTTDKPAARKAISTATQLYLRKHYNLGDKFVVFRAETQQAGLGGRRHIPVATSLSADASSAFVEPYAIGVGKLGNEQGINSVQAYLVDMKDVLFYGPAWRETAQVGAKGRAGVAFGTLEEEIMVYADKLVPIDVAANATGEQIQRTLREQMGIHPTSRLATAGKQVPKPETRPRYPGVDDLDIEGLAGLGSSEPVLGRYFVPKAYKEMLAELTTDPDRRSLSRALGFTSKASREFVDSKVPSNVLARWWSNYMDWYVSALLATSVEVVAHSYRILGVLSRTPINGLPDNLAALTPYWGPRLKGLVDMFHVMQTQEGVAMEAQIARIGGGTNRRFMQVGNDMGTSIGTVVEKMTGSKKAGHALEWGRDFLFGQPETGRAGLYGFDQRARVAAAVNVNKVMQKRLQRNLTDSELRSFLEGFGKYNENLQNNMFLLLRKSKLSPFAGGQAGMIPREIAQTITGSPGLPKAVLDELGSKVAWQLRGEVYARGIGGTAVWLTALQYAWSGSFPWDNEKGHKLDLKVGYLPDGRAVYLPATTYMPGMSRALGLTGMRALYENAGNPAAALPEAKRRLINTPITYGVAGAPGMGAGMTMIMGTTTYLNEQGQFMRVVPPVSGSGFKKEARQVYANAVTAVTGANPTVEELFGFTMEGETLPTSIRIINALTTGLKVGREPELAVSADVRQQRAAFFEASRSRVVEALATWPEEVESRKIYYKREAAKWDDPDQEKAAYLNMLRNDVSIRQARRRNAIRAERDQPF